MKLDVLNIPMDILLCNHGYVLTFDAAIEGDADAQCYLGMVWEKGGDDSRDLPVSFDQAIRWFQ